MHDDAGVEYCPEDPPGKFSAAMANIASTVTQKLGAAVTCASSMANAKLYGKEEAFLRRWELREHFFASLKKRGYKVHMRVRGPTTYAFVSTGRAALLKQAEKSKVYLPLRGTIWEISKKPKSPTVNIWTAHALTELQSATEARNRNRANKKSAKVAPADAEIRRQSSAVVSTADQASGDPRMYKWRKRRKMVSAAMHTFPEKNDARLPLAGCLVEPPIDFAWLDHGNEGYTPDYDFERTKQFLFELEDAYPNQPFVLMVPLIAVLDAMSKGEVDYDRANRYTVVAASKLESDVPRVAGDYLQMFHNFVSGSESVQFRGQQRQLKPSTVSCILFHGGQQRDCELPPSCLLWTDETITVPSVRITHDESVRLRRYTNNREQLKDTVTPDIEFSAKDQFGRKRVNRCDIEVGFKVAETSPANSWLANSPKAFQNEALATTTDANFRLNNDALTDDDLKDQVDFIGAPFQRSKAEFFVGFHGNSHHAEEKMGQRAFDRIMWSGRRQDLCVEALERLDIRNIPRHGDNGGKNYTKMLVDLLPPHRRNDADLQKTTRCNLSYLLEHNVFDDVFVPHDRDSVQDESRLEANQAIRARMRAEEGEDPGPVTTFTKQMMNDTRVWTYVKWAAQGRAPIQDIRRYLGERVAMYVCWVETLNSTMLLPIIAGIVCALYGLCIVAIGQQDFWLGTPCNNHILPANVSTNATDGVHNSTSNGTVPPVVGSNDSVLEALTNNEATPVFALIICIWCSFFSESWKRVQITKAVEWDVTELEEEERPVETTPLGQLLACARLMALVAPLHPCLEEEWSGVEWGCVKMRGVGGKVEGGEI